MNQAQGASSAIRISYFQGSSEISDLCEISDLLIFVGNFASQIKGMKFGDYFFDVCCIN